MNKIPRPLVDDSGALQKLAFNPDVGSYPNLQGVVAAIQQGYVKYEAACGNAFAITNVALTKQVEDYLKAHYKQPPGDVKHITELRESTEHLSCPMCGSFHRGTLDHLLPQAKYSSFSLYSLNLVPACKCNSKRKDKIIGVKPAERILHPYFDDCLSERLFGAHFEDVSAVPKIGLQLFVDNTHPDFAAIDFHFCSIVKRTAITRHLRKKWSDLCRKPSLAIRALKSNPSTLVELRQIIEDELELLDETHEGINNWDSVFVVGLLDSNVLNWIFQRMHMGGRLPNAPLV